MFAGATFLELDVCVVQPARGAMPSLVGIGRWLFGVGTLLELSDLLFECCDLFCCTRLLLVLWWFAIWTCNPTFVAKFVAFYVHVIALLAQPKLLPTTSGSALLLLLFAFQPCL